MNILKNIKNKAIFRGKNRIINALVAGVIVGICLSGVIVPQVTNADFANATNSSYVAKESLKSAKAVQVKVTAYSSSFDQTDDTPFTTASGKQVQDGIIANNMLPFGTKVRIPELYGDKVFTVQDRMNSRKSDYHIDIWMPSRPLAINFGVKTTTMEILED